ncbi:hypothetical protein G4G28_17330 [Massilia sp. Dwa41.01b]|uniref:hypothetical protein n=1 Tax=Massilia sp. Dwa41.01b TaxID=2709302 RepID=UPI0015FF0F88|nr:hypothetical protein [Massilia sp. Dwa41.01b]QNA89801.1 hypothetical protein G4G28_17330 [Massilia sp. Dwa41.01b]
MEINRITLPPITGPGEVTAFYSFESGAARSAALANTAVLLAGRQNATLPVLMIDWDLEAPGLHLLFPTRDERFENEHPDTARPEGLRPDTPRADVARPDVARPDVTRPDVARPDVVRPDSARPEASRPGMRPPAMRPGLLEYFEACREQLETLSRTCAHADDDERARLTLEAIDWEAYVERVDQSRTLYLMRAGRFDDSYGERADRMDWDGLFAACPALFRAFAAHLARQFRHILIDCRSGRSAAVSVCTTLLPDKLVGIFGPGARSLDGLAGVVARAIEYRCSHEEAQRPLLVYPVPYGGDGMDAERRLLWRRGDPQRAPAGYQPVLEQLLRNCYGLSQVSLDSYLDEVQLQAGACMVEHPGFTAERDADRLSLTRGIEGLLAWAADSRFPGSRVPSWASWMR